MVNVSSITRNPFLDQKIKSLFLFKFGFLQNLFEAFLPGLHPQTTLQMELMSVTCSGFAVRSWDAKSTLAFVKTWFKNQTHTSSGSATGAL